MMPTHCGKTFWTYFLDMLLVRIFSGSMVHAKVARAPRKAKKVVMGNSCCHEQRFSLRTFFCHLRLYVKYLQPLFRF